MESAKIGWEEKSIPRHQFKIGDLLVSDETAKSLNDMGIKLRVTETGDFLCFVSKCCVCGRTETTNMLPKDCVGMNNCPRAKIAICSDCCEKQCPDGIKTTCSALGAVKAAL